MRNGKTMSPGEPSTGSVQNQVENQNDIQNNIQNDIQNNIQIEEMMQFRKSSQTQEASQIHNKMQIHQDEFRHIQKHRPGKMAKMILLTVILLFAVYATFIYFLVSACLVPDFMAKLDAFEEITTKSYSEQVHTTDIGENRKAAIQATNEWLKHAQCRKLSMQSEDGYELIAVDFYAKDQETDSPLAQEPLTEVAETCNQKNNSHRWVLLLHGYTGWKEEMYPFAYWYHEQGYRVLVPDLRCQGESDGDFIGMGWTDHYDCERWIEYIVDMDPQAQIVLHGQSMGAATALIMSGDVNLSDHVQAIVSDCAYTDAYSMFGDKIVSWFHLPPFPFVDSACLMLRLRGGYDLRLASALDGVKRSQMPTLFIHGDKDAMIPATMSKELYENASCEKELLIVEGAGHAQSQDKAPQEYYDTVESFLDKHVK